MLRSCWSPWPIRRHSPRRPGLRGPIARSSAGATRILTCITVSMCRAQSSVGTTTTTPLVFEPGASPLLQTGTYLGLSGELAYSWQGKRVQVGAAAGSNPRYYRDTAELIETNRYGSIGFSAGLGRRGHIFANQSISYAPSYLYSLIPGVRSALPGVAVGGGSFPVGNHSVYVYDTTAMATIGITRRGSIEALSSYRLSDFGDSSDATVTALRSYSLGGALSLRHLSIRVASIGLRVSGRPIRFRSDECECRYWCTRHRRWRGLRPRALI